MEEPSPPPLPPPPTGRRSLCDGKGVLEPLVAHRISSSLPAQPRVAHPPRLDHVKRAQETNRTIF